MSLSLDLQGVREVEELGFKSLVSGCPSVFTFS